MPRGRRPPIDPDDAAAAEDAAVRILAAAAQTEVTLRRRLQQRGFSAAAAHAAATSLARRGYVDEEAFARSLVERRVRSGHGRALVVAELRARGVGERPIHEAIHGADTGEVEQTEYDAALRLAQAMAARESRLTAERLAGRLARRGFGFETVRQVLRVLRLPARES